MHSCLLRGSRRVLVLTWVDAFPESCQPELSAALRQQLVVPGVSAAHGASTVFPGGVATSCDEEGQLSDVVFSCGPF
jgi:hypothetical protein